MHNRTKIYFASDFHLGAYPLVESQAREKLIINWLDSIKHDARELYLVGDIFDFWFEYKTVIPRGYIRFLGKLAELVDAGVQLSIFKGNHDMWMFDYFQEQLKAQIIADELIIHRDHHSFYIHHGDGLGPGDRRYKILKKFFRSRFCQWLFARLHPNLGIGIAQKWSQHSRLANQEEEKFLGEDKEWLILHSRALEQQQHHDFYIYGHRHLPYDIALNSTSRILNLGEWINFYTYAVWDGQSLNLREWKD